MTTTATTVITGTTVADALDSYRKSQNTSATTEEATTPPADTTPTSNKNGNLTAARKAKNDEFYTQFRDIETELNKYVDYNADAFRGKTILLPCDDPEWSNFTKFLALKFDDFGIKKIISTSYNPGGQGKVFTLDGDFNADGHVNLDDLQWEYLNGDGDFRSDEVLALRDRADIIITNPPFSLFRAFLAWIMEANKQFLIIGSKNAVTYKEVFPLIRDNKMWAGTRPWSGGMWFELPADADKFDRMDGDMKMGNAPSAWFTNIDHGRRHEPLELMTTAENLLYGKGVAGKAAYDQYDNYDAIEVPWTKAIPSDHDSVMGVPITFLDKYCPEQFEIVGMSANGIVDDTYKLPHFKKHNEPFIDGKKTYQRIFIQHRTN